VKLAELAAKRVELETIRAGNKERTVKIITGVIVTGDVFAASSAKCVELREKFGADAVEMEGGAVAQICYQQGVRHLVVRCISDKADEKALEDVNKFLKVAARNSASLTTKIIEHLGSEVSIEK
jgi:adenosylhomocysteine nucleosidase